MSPCPRRSCPASRQGARWEPVPQPRWLTQHQQVPPLHSSASHQRPQGELIRTAGEREQKPTGDARSSESHPSRSASEGNQVPHSATPKKTKYYMKTPIKLLVLFLKASSWGLGAHRQRSSSAFAEKGRPRVARPRNCNAVRRPGSRPLF